MWFSLSFVACAPLRRVLRIAVTSIRQAYVSIRQACVMHTSALRRVLRIAVRMIFFFQAHARACAVYPSGYTAKPSYNNACYIYNKYTGDLLLIF